MVNVVRDCDDLGQFSTSWWVGNGASAVFCLTEQVKVDPGQRNMEDMGQVDGVDRSSGSILSLRLV